MPTLQIVIHRVIVYSHRCWEAGDSATNSRRRNLLSYHTSSLLTCWVLTRTGFTSHTLKVCCFCSMLSMCVVYFSRVHSSCVLSGDDNIPTDIESKEIWEGIFPSDRVIPGSSEVCILQTLLVKSVFCHFFQPTQDNFWSMGEYGPCGPSTEIHYDKRGTSDGGKLVNQGTEDVIEIWNIVFTMYDRKSQTEFQELPGGLCVDTGMGLEVYLLPHRVDILVDIFM